MKQFFRKNKTIRTFENPEEEPGVYTDQSFEFVNEAKRKSRELQNEECGSHNGRCLRVVQKLPTTL